MDLSNLQVLTQLDGISGREQAVRSELARQLAPLASHVQTDSLGNLLAFVPGSGDKTVVLCAHMDEVGLMVTYIAPDGFLSFTPVGGIDPRTLLAQRVTVHTAQGPLTGVIGTKPAHITQEAERGRAVAMNELFIDVGLSGAEANRRVKVGDWAALQRAYEPFGENRICSKALDNRVGCFCVLEALKRVAKPALQAQVIFSVQEELGSRGAATAMFGREADIAFAIDATGAADIPLCRPQDYLVRLGGGVAITAMDATSMTAQPVFDGLLQLCQTRQITHQVRIAPRGGNDAGVLQRAGQGRAACSLSIPVRNIHSNVEVTDTRDIAATIDLLSAILEGHLRCN